MTAMSRVHAPLLALLVVALMLPMPMINAQSSVYPNLVITDLKILDQYDTPQWIDGEVTPASVEIEATIENNGGSPSSGYRINYYWVGESGVNWLNGQQSNSFDVSEEVISPEDPPYKQPPMTWDIQPDQRGSGALRAVLQPSGYDRNSTDNTFTLPIDLDIHDLQLSIPGPGQDLHNPEETGFVRVNVHNAGTTTDSIDLGIVTEQVQPADRHGDVTPTLQYTTLTVAPGETERSTLFVDYRFSGDDGGFTAVYDIEAVTSYGRTLHATTPVFTGVAGNDEPPAGSPVDLDRADSEPLNVPLFGSVTRGFTVTNTGTARDSYKITLDTDPGWTATVGLEGLEDGPSIRIALAPGEAQTFRMTLHAPDDAVAGQPTTAGVKVESDHGADDVLRTWPFRVDGPAVRIEALPDWDLSPYQGDPVRAWVRVHNDGNAPTPAGSVLRLLVEDGDDLDVTMEPDGNIPADGSMDLLIGSSDNLTGSGEVTFTVDWVVPGDPIHREPLEVDGFIRVPDAVITAADGLTGAPGETVRYRTGDHAFVVRNDGNARETFVVAAATDGGDVERVTSGSVTLDPGQQRTIPIDHRLPLPTGPTKHINVSLRVAVDGRTDLNWTANTTTDILDQSPPLIDAATLPVEWALDGNLSVRAVVSDDSAVETVNVTHTAPDGTRTVHAMAPDQDEDEEDGWVTDITLDAVGDHAFTMQATDIHGNNATVDLGKVKVWPIPAPELALVGPADGTVVTPNTTYQVNVSDERPISLVQVLFEDDQGATIWTADLDPGSESLMFNLSAAPNGPLKITVQATNDAGAKAAIVRSITMEGQPEQEVVTTDGPDEPKSTPSPSVAAVLAALAALARRMRGRTPPPTDALRTSVIPSISSPGARPSHPATTAIHPWRPTPCTLHADPLEGGTP